MTAIPDEAVDDLVGSMQELGQNARAAASVLALAASDLKNRALVESAKALRSHMDSVLSANASDMESGQAKGLSPAMLDRLMLDAERIGRIAVELEAIADLPDPIGDVIAEWDRPNGLGISRVRVPLGVIGIIYESRPNVTADAGALALKAGNACILRGGSESFHSSAAIHACLVEGLRAAGLPDAAVQLVPTTDRAAVGMMLTMSDAIDIIVPRGGKGLIERVHRESRIPVIAHLDGICHVYVDGAADPQKAVGIGLNAKMRRTGICGACETLLVDRAAIGLLPAIADALLDTGCELRGDEVARAADDRIAVADAADWDTEYLDAILSIAVVDGVEGAIAHIARHSSHHTESIITEDTSAAAKFLNEVDSAIVMHNASTQFADGGEFGMGAEIGISTGKLHARGPVGAEQLTSYKYIVRGDGQVRP